MTRTYEHQIIRFLQDTPQCCFSPREIADELELDPTLVYVRCRSLLRSRQIKIKPQSHPKRYFYPSKQF